MHFIHTLTYEKSIMLVPWTLFGISSHGHRLAFVAP